MKKDDKPSYRIIGAYDSETTNYNDSGIIKAFPILHQLGILDGTPIEQITPENVEQHTDIELYRHTLDLYERLDSIVDADSDFVPVICCHNLSFDMYGLAQFFERHTVRVLAKSARKPITFTIYKENGQIGLVIWDTLIFTQMSLERMGKDCGYYKGVGEWDYNLIRTTETPLTDEELDYSKRDIYTLIAYMGYWLRMNSDIAPEKLGLNVVTKTGVVRERRKVRFLNLKGKGKRYNIGQFWYYQNKKELPKTDDELFTMQAAMRGGFTFCASKNASVVFNLENTGKHVFAFDATSQHPGQIVSHYLPENFHETSGKVLTLAFELVQIISLQRVLDRWENPFNVAFYGCFEFTNLRPKSGSIFEKYGILPLASARYKPIEFTVENEDNGDKNSQDENRRLAGYVDSVINPVCEFGKLVSADLARLYITELTAWEICQCYDFDTVKGISGYITGQFTKPSDMCIVSVMQFYKAKNEFKHARKCFYDGKQIDNAETLKQLGVSSAVVDSMCDGSISERDIESTYLSLKADLNALFGIEASNEFRRDTILTSNGIEFSGDFGLCNAPANPKAWYQFGTRIVGWSRIAQICVMQLASPYCDTIINGDTDSIKVLADDENLLDIIGALEKLSNAIDKAKEKVCKRVCDSYPKVFDDLHGIGHYVLEFESDSFCASWNKAYCTHDIDEREGKRRYHFTLAGIPTGRRSNDVSSFLGIDGYCDLLDSAGWTFEQVCNLFLGYNVTFANDVIRMNGRKFPVWGDTFYSHVTDYLGNECLVCEPAALALYPMSKTINDTNNQENKQNSIIALQNNPSVNIIDKLVYSKGVLDLNDIWSFDNA